MAEDLSPEQLEELREIAKLPPEEQKARLPAFLQKLSPGQIQALKQIQATPQCIFCRIVNKEIPAKIVYEDEGNLAFLDIKPANPGHVLVIPKKHYQFLPQMPDDEVAELFKVVKTLTSAVFEATGAEGISIRQRNGSVAGQVVPHVHVHIIPRFKDDGIEQDWRPRELTEEQFSKIQKAISERIIKPAEKEKPKEEKKGRPPKIQPRLP